MQTDVVASLVLWLLGAVISVLVWWAPGAMFMFVVVWVVGRLIERSAPLDDRRFLIQLFWWGIGARVVAATLAHVMAMYLEMGFPYLMYGEQSHDLFGDAAVLSLQAKWTARYWAGAVDPTGTDLSQFFGPGNSPLIYPYAAFYYAFGFSPLALKWLHSLFGVLTGLVVYVVGRAAAPDRRVARIASLGTMFFPSIFLWSLSSLKEAPTMLVISLIVWSAVKLSAGFRWRYSFSLIAWMIVLGMVRKAMVVPIIVALLISWWWTWRLRLRWKLSLLVGCAVFLLCVNQVGGLGQRWTRASVEAWGVRVGNSVIEPQRAHALRDGSSYQIYPSRIYLPTKLSYHPFVLSWQEWVRAGLVGWGYFLFAPFPWNISTMLQVVAYPEMMVWYALVLFWVPVMWVGLRTGHRPIVTLTMLACVLSLAAGLVTGNIGTGFRHRAVVIPIFLLLSAIGYCRRTLRISHAG